MTLQETQYGSVGALAVDGRIDTTTSPALEDALARLIDRGTRDLLVDLASVDYISSAGLRVLLVVAKRIRDLRGRLVLCGLTDPVRQVFDLAGFLPLFTIADTRDTALARFATMA